MLASVRTLEEALFALNCGADFIDLKEPSLGALGALDHAAVRVMVHAINKRRPLSSTIGDIPSMDPVGVMSAVERMVETGVDFVKIGFFANDRTFACARSLAEVARRARLVAVIFADEPYEITLVDTLAGAGFAGAMLDTASKSGKSLRDWRSNTELEAFVNRARGLGLLTGLAGSLSRNDIAPMLALRPDYLGFRGALCRNADRGQVLDADAFRRVRVAIPPQAAPIRRVLVA